MKNVFSDREKKIIISLINSKERLTLKKLNMMLKVSERTIYCDLNNLESIFAKYEVELVRKPRNGIWLKGDEESFKRLLADVNNNVSDIPQNSKDRQKFILSKLVNAKDFITIETLSNEIYVSRKTVEKDIDLIKAYVKKFGLEIRGKTNKGLIIVGDERNKRELILDMFNKSNNLCLIEDLIHKINETKNKDIESIIESNLKFMFKKEEIEFIRKLIIEVEGKLGHKFSDIAFTSLVLHIVIAINRLKSENFIKLSSDFINSIEKTSEFHVSKWMVSRLEEEFNMKFPIEENAYIAMHLLGAKIQLNIKNNEILDKITANKDIMDLCSRMVLNASEKLNIPYYMDEDLIKGLMVHIIPVVNRLQNNMIINNPYLEEIKKNYITSFEAGIYSLEVIKEDYKVEYNEDEIGFIALHYEAALERLRKANDKIKKVLIVCGSGMGTSQLVAAKLKNVLQNIEIIGTISALSLNKDIEDASDLIISTIPLSNKNNKIVQVSSFLSNEDVDKIKRKLVCNNLDKVKAENVSLNSILINKEYVFVNVEAKTKEDIIKNICYKLYRDGYVSKDYEKAIINREKIASTRHGSVCLPHGEFDKVKKSIVTICILKEPVFWDTEKVKIVILFAISEKEINKYSDFFEKLYFVISNEKLIKELSNCNKKEEVIRLLNLDETSHKYNLNNS